MKCDELLKVLSDYVDGQVDPTLCQELEKHLGGCDACRVVVDNLRKTIAVYQGEKVVELPAEFQTRLQQTLQAKWKQRPQGPAPAAPQR